MLKFLLLSLLARSPHYGYELKQAFHDLLGGTWVLNPGQVYSTLSRLEEDGLIEPTVVEQQLLPDRKVFSLTPVGRKELERWFSEPVSGLIRLREEVFLKIVAQGISDPTATLELIAVQRTEYIDAIAQVSRRRIDPNVPDSTKLILSGLLRRLEADLIWLDDAEAHFKGTHSR